MTKTIPQLDPLADPIADDDRFVGRDTSNGDDRQFPPAQVRAYAIATLALTTAGNGASLVGYDNSSSGLTAEDVQDALDELAGSSIDGFEAMPLNTPFPVLDNLTGASVPDNSGTAKFIKLTAGEDGAGQYNEGLLTNESVTGTAPLVVATADIDTGPLSGQTVNLWNTENRYPMPGTFAGTVGNDQMQQITGDFVGGRSGAATSGAFTNGVLTGTTSATGSGAAEYERFFDSADSPGARTGDHTNVKHQQVTYYMRIV